MADIPVRRAILIKLETAFETIQEIRTVRIFKPVPNDILATELPALYLFEIQPEDRFISNRLAGGTMHFLAQVYISNTILDANLTAFADAYELMDIIAARLHHLYHDDVGLSKNGLVKLDELQYDRIITNDSISVLNSTFTLEYRHDRGNAFS